MSSSEFVGNLLLESDDGIVSVAAKVQGAVPDMPKAEDPSRVVSPRLGYSLSIKLAGNEKKLLSFANHRITLRVTADTKLLAKATVRGVCRNGALEISGVMLDEGAFADLTGAVSLQIALSNSNGLSESVCSDWLFVAFESSETGRNLANMMGSLQENASLLLPQKIVGGKKGRTGGGAGSWMDLVSKIVATFDSLHRFFEHGARFRLELRERICDFANVSTVTPATLGFIASHPEELVRTDGRGVITRNGKRFAPQRSIDIRAERRYDTPENTAIVGFLAGVLEAVENARPAVANLQKESGGDSASGSFGLFEEVVGKKLRSSMSAASRVRALLARYAVLFGIERPVPLRRLPHPTSVFVSVAAYRQAFELMREWFAAPMPEFAEENLLLRVGRSSRLYEQYVLGLLARALSEGSELQDKERTSADEGGMICDRFRFVRDDGAEVTLWYEPRIVAGVSRRNDKAPELVRTISGESLAYGVYSGIEGDFWTPDYVIRIEDAKGVRYWIADAKFSTRNTVMREQVREVFFKYLMATGTVNQEDTVAGLVLFCGKGPGTEQVFGDMRDIDCVRGREVELLTACMTGSDTERDMQAVRAWVDRL